MVGLSAECYWPLYPVCLLPIYVQYGLFGMCVGWPCRCDAISFSFGSRCVMIGEFIHVDTMATAMLRNEVDVFCRWRDTVLLSPTCECPTCECVCVCVCLNVCVWVCVCVCVCVRECVVDVLG